MVPRLLLTVLADGQHLHLHLYLVPTREAGEEACPAMEMAVFATICMTMMTTMATRSTPGQMLLTCVLRAAEAPTVAAGSDLVLPPCLHRCTMPSTLTALAEPVLLVAAAVVAAAALPVQSAVPLSIVAQPVAAFGKAGALGGLMMGAIAVALQRAGAAVHERVMIMMMQALRIMISMIVTMMMQMHPLRSRRSMC